MFRPSFIAQPNSGDNTGRLIKRLRLCLRMNRLGNPNRDLLWQPADHGHLPASFAALAAVGIKILDSAAGAGADLEELLAGHADGAQDVAIEPA